MRRRFCPMWRAALAIVLACVVPLARVAAAPRIADGWYAHNSVLVMLGASSQIVATVASPAAFPWMYRVAPAMARAEFMHGPPMNVDGLVALHTNIAFVTPADPSAGRIRATGIKTVEVAFADFPSMLDCIDLTAQVLGTPLARQRAAAYRRYLESTLAGLRARRDTPDTPAPRVLHIASFQPLRVDGADTIVDAWIRAAGGQNAATGVVGNLRPVSMEQVLAWQPQLIIVGDDPHGIEGRPDYALWEQVSAVRAGKVYRNPRGVFPWDRYGPELALQVQWAADVIAHGRIDDVRLTAETTRFYQQFFDYSLSQDEALRILHAEPPAAGGKP
jgi:iron complex transport system substrate-binding protein